MSIVCQLDPVFYIKQAVNRTSEESDPCNSTLVTIFQHTKHFLKHEFVLENLFQDVCLEA